MSHDLARKPRLRAEALDPARYVPSLLEEGAACGVFSQEDVERFSMDCLALLARLSRQVLRGDSTSMPVETAQALLESALYTMGVYLKTLSSADEAAETLLTTHADELYQKGRARVDRLLSICRLMQARILHNVFRTPNAFYLDTLSGGVNGFFKLYDPISLAQDKRITADYPPCLPVVKLKGVEFMKIYLERLCLENDFCTRLDNTRARAYLKTRCPGYEDAPVNLFEPLLAGVLGCALLSGASIDALKRKNAALTLRCKRLELSEDDVLQLNARLRSLDRADVLRVLHGAADIVRTVLSLPRQLSGYIHACLPPLAARALSPGGLIPAEGEPKRVLYVSMGERMPDPQYRELIVRINARTTPLRKSELVRASVHSLLDIEDILHDAAFSKADTRAVLKLLSMRELAVLYQRGASIAALSLLPPSRREQLARIAETIQIENEDNA